MQNQYSKLLDELEQKRLKELKRISEQGNKMYKDSYLSKEL